LRRTTFPGSTENHWLPDITFMDILSTFTCFSMSVWALFYIVYENFEFMGKKVDHIWETDEWNMIDDKNTDCTSGRLILTNHK
jgi:hypothetical protein